MEDHYAGLGERGFALVSSFADTECAFGVARELIEERNATDGLSALEVIGDFVLPPNDGPETRDFQTLHFDFGLPLDPMVHADVARYTALYVPAGVEDVSAVTRLVPLIALLGQHSWPNSAELVRRLVAYGKTRGTREGAAGYVEGSLARLVEAAAGTTPVLPSVKTDPDFLCGMEFDGLRSELVFFEDHGLDVEAVQVEVFLQPGELLVFDNLAMAHGRRGVRQPGELRQRVFGHGALAPLAQRRLRDSVLTAFQASQAERTASLVSVSTP